MVAKAGAWHCGPMKRLLGQADTVAQGLPDDIASIVHAGAWRAVIPHVHVKYCRRAVWQLRWFVGRRPSALWGGAESGRRGGGGLGGLQAIPDVEDAIGTRFFEG